MIYDPLTADNTAFLGRWFVCGSRRPGRAGVARRNMAFTQTPAAQA